ncbi:hypothetical protein D9M71_802590 [compost metagenome]
MIERPATQYRIQLSDQILLPYRFAGTDDLPYLAIERFHVFLAWLDQKLPIVLAEIPT